MIYLFDDTSGLYISKYINTLEFTDVLVHVSAISGGEVKLMEPSLRNAEWIFIHKSFKDSEGGPREVYDYVVNEIADYGDEVPLILFSDEDRPEPQIDRDYKNLIEAYKKSVFYSHLSSFLENRRMSGEAKIDLLLYGAGVEIEKVTESGGRILTANRTKADGDIIGLEDFSAADMMYVINSARPNIEIEYATLMQLVEQGKVSAGALRRNINGIIESFIVYGTNIHHWE